MRLNSAGGGGNVTLGAATTTINTLLQNTSTAATIDTAGKILRLGATGGMLVPASMQSLTLAPPPTPVPSPPAARTTARVKSS